MLVKLLKYELLASARIILPAYAGALVFSLLVRLTLAPAAARGILGGLFSVLMGISIFAVVVLTLICIVQRFYSNLFKDEGYLTHTLPVSIDTLIWSKLLVAFFWIVAGGQVFVISEWLRTGYFAGFSFAFSDNFWLMSPQGSLVVLDFALSLISSIVTMLMWILMGYCALAIGQLAKRAKILCSVFVFIGLLIGYAYLFVQVFFRLFEHVGYTQMSFFTVTLIYTLLQGVFYYFVTRSILRYWLNLE